MLNKYLLEGYAAFFFVRTQKVFVRLYKMLVTVFVLREGSWGMRYLDWEDLFIDSELPQKVLSLQRVRPCALVWADYHIYYLVKEKDIVAQKCVLNDPTFGKN